MSDELRVLQVEEDNMNGGWYVIMHVTCYAATFGDDAYPPALENFAYTRDTKFVIALKDEQGEFFEGLDYDEAVDIARDYEEEFGDLVKEIENNASWNEWPEELDFDADDVIYHH